MLVTCSGILVADIIAADLPKVSEPGELIFTEREIELHIGGHSGNVSIDLIKLGLNLGEVSCVGAVGEDFFGDFIEGILKDHGIKTHLQRVKDAGTSKDLVLVVRGEDRRFHVYVGANWHLSLEYVKSVLTEEKPLVSYLGGVGLLGEFDEKLAEVLQLAKKYQCLTFVDPVTPYKREWEIIIPALRWTDIFHCNDVEAYYLTGEKNPKRAAKKIVKYGAKFVVVSLGERGLIAETQDTSFTMPAFKVPVIDPTGAGDAFCAGFIQSLVEISSHEPSEISEFESEDLTRILLKGEAAGAACVTMVGTTTAVTKTNVDKLLNEQGSMILDKCCLKKQSVRN